MTNELLTKARETIPVLLKSRREGLGLSVQTLADKCNVQKTTIYRIEAGKFMPNIELFITIAHHLKIEINIK